MKTLPKKALSFTLRKEMLIKRFMMKLEFWKKNLMKEEEEIKNCGQKLPN
jgi:hypothetical protein